MRRASSLPWIPVALVCIGLIVSLWPLFRKGFFVTDDGEWMVIRLSAFYQSFAGGQFPVRYLGRLNNSYGYPVANFLYPGYLYIGTLLSGIGFSFVNAVKIILGLSVAGSTLLLYASLRRRFSPTAVIAGIFSFLFAPYLLFDLYARGSVGEVLGIFSATLSVFAVMGGLPWLLAPSVALLILSHNTVALISGVAIAGLIVARRQRVQFVIAAALGVGMAGFFWLPALVEKGLVRFDWTVVSDPSRYFITLEQAGLLGASTGIAILIILGRRLKILPHEKIMILFAAAGFFMALPVSKPLWETGLVTKLVQFPYRFLVLPVLFGPWITARAFEKLNGWRLIVVSFLFILMWGSYAWTIMSRIEYVDRPEGYYSTNEGTTNVANEYMPRWVSDIPITRPVETLEVMGGDAELSERTFAGERMDFTVTAKEASLIQINKIFYPGWGVTIDNALTPVTFNNPLGVMRFTVPTGIHKVSASFRETPFRFGADVLSLVSGIYFLVIVRRLRNIS